MSGSDPRGAYRPALDGVRAFAVAAVIAFHLTEAGPRGGFLGVDVFFVLSGYLITGILLGARGAPAAWLLDFWMRRARRLLPALLLLLAVTAAVVALDAPPEELGARRADVVATLAYFANWHFVAAGTSYFESFVDSTPLRHMWSLSIEEQFYLAWPLLVAAVAVLPRRLRLASLLAGCLTGIALSAYRMAALYDPLDPSRSYYGTDTRAQSLLVGCTLAVLVARHPGLIRSGRSRTLARLAGLPVAALLVAAVLAVDETSRHYYAGGAGAFAIVVAVALWVVETAPAGRLARALSARPVRWTGAVSYGLYLWHWPVIVWMNAWWGGAPAWLRQPAELALIVAVATASYYLVELPLRSGRFPGIRRSNVRLVLALAVAVAAVGGLAGRTTAGTDPFAGALNDLSDTPCPAGSPDAGWTYIRSRKIPASWCVRTSAGRSAAVVVTAGDSTSRALDPGMRRVAEERGWTYVQAGVRGCSLLRLPIVPPGSDALAVRQARSCGRTIPRLVERIVAAHHPSLWIVADSLAGDPTRDSLSTRSTRSMLERLTEDGASVIVLEPAPPAQPLSCLEHDDRACRSVTHTVRHPYTRAIARTTRAAASQLAGRVAVVSANDILCPGGICVPVVSGMLARFDTIHFTSAFSRYLVPIVVARAERQGLVLP